MTLMSPKAYARAREVSDQTVYDAITAGLIVLEPDGRLDVEATDAGWYAEHLARKERIKATEASRAKATGAAALASMAAISNLGRQLREANRATALRSDAQPAAGRRAGRLQAALDMFPAVCTPAAAEALQQPPAPVRAAMRQFVELIAADIGDLYDAAGRLAG